MDQNQVRLIVSQPGSKTQRIFDDELSHVHEKQADDATRDTSSISSLKVCFPFITKNLMSQ